MKLPLLQFLETVKRVSDNSEYVNAISRHARDLSQNELPLLITLGSIAQKCGVPYDYVNSILHRHTNPYKTFRIKKRSGGSRTICVPDIPLMRVQRWIHKEILLSTAAKAILSKWSTAYAENSSHIKNAEKHLGAQVIIKVDISNFFESISERQVYKVFKNLQFRPIVAFGLTRICTRQINTSKSMDLRVRKSYRRWNRRKRTTEINRRLFLANAVGHLPQGAPTSPMLSNLVCLDIDNQLAVLAREHEMVFTRYADDITFSGPLMDVSKMREVYSKICEIVGVFGLRVNAKKTRFIRAGCRMQITGIVINNGIARISREYRDRIRQELFYLKKCGLESHVEKVSNRNALSYLLGLDARINYVISIEPKCGNIFRVAFDELFPEFPSVRSIMIANDSPNDEM